MDEKIQESLNGYLELFDKISGKIQDAATAVVLLQEIAKDQRVERMIEERGARNGQPAIFKQRRFMDNS